MGLCVRKAPSVWRLFAQGTHIGIFHRTQRTCQSALAHPRGEAARPRFPQTTEADQAFCLEHFEHCQVTWSSRRAPRPLYTSCVGSQTPASPACFWCFFRNGKSLLVKRPAFHPVIASSDPASLQAASTLRTSSGFLFRSNEQAVSAILVERAF